MIWRRDSEFCREVSTTVYVPPVCKMCVRARECESFSSPFLSPLEKWRPRKKKTNTMDERKTKYRKVLGNDNNKIPVAISSDFPNFFLFLSLHYFQKCMYANVFHVLAHLRSLLSRKIKR